MSFDDYNESDVLIVAVDSYFERAGHYPERALADKIHRPGRIWHSANCTASTNRGHSWDVPKRMT